MNRRKFLSFIGLAPLLGLARKLPAVPSPVEPVTGLSIAKLIQARDLLNAHDHPPASGGVHEFMGFKFVRAGSCSQKVECRPDMCHAWQITTRVKMPGRDEVVGWELWDEDPNPIQIEAHRQKTWCGALRLWTRTERWKRKANEATARFHRARDYLAARQRLLDGLLQGVGPVTDSYFKSVKALLR